MNSNGNHKWQANEKLKVYFVTALFGSDEAQTPGLTKKKTQAPELCFDESYLERLFILVLLLELKQECWSLLKPNT